MRVRTLKKRISLLERNGGDDELLAQLISALLTKLDAPEDMSIQDLIRRLTSLTAPKAKAKKPKLPTDEVVRSIVATLNSAFSDDEAFATALNALRAQRSATKPVLAQVFYTLFQRDRGVPKTGTRDELLRLIADERHILARNEKMGRMLGRRIVPAE